MNSVGKKMALALAVLAAVGGAGMAQAATFAPGDLVVYRVGTGTTLTNGATAVYLDEFSPAGVKVQSIAMPNDLLGVTGANKYLTASGTATSEGMLNLSPNGQWLTLTGYNAPVGTASIAGSSASTYSRTVAIVDGTGAVDSTTSLTDWVDKNNPRTAITTDGTSLWIGGANGGVRYTTKGSTSGSIQLTTSPTNIREVAIFGGQLYGASSSGLVGVYSVGTGEPTTAGQTATMSASSTSAYQFVLLHTTGPGTATDTMYVANDSASQIQKFVLNGSTWTASGYIASSAVRGLTAQVTSAGVTLYAATGGSAASANGMLSTYTDATGLGTISAGATATVLTTSATGLAYRGVAYAPITSATSTVSLTSAVAAQGTNLAIGGNVNVTWTGDGYQSEVDLLTAHTAGGNVAVNWNGQDNVPNDTYAMVWLAGSAGDIANLNAHLAAGAGAGGYDLLTSGDLFSALATQYAAQATGTFEVLDFHSTTQDAAFNWYFGADTGVIVNAVAMTSPVPEPMSLGLLALGALGILVRRRR